jgi:YgiT-type zinc finger domain-containing protein
MTKSKSNDKCYYCGGVDFEQRRTHYIYSREGQNLFVPDMPVEICRTCGMVFYDGAALLEVEQRFNAIYHGHEKYDQFTTMPMMSMSEMN